MTVVASSHGMLEVCEGGRPPAPAAAAAAGVIDVTEDSGSEAMEIVDISDADDGGVSEVSHGAPPLWFRGYRRGQELGRGSSGKVFMCSRKGRAGGFAVKVVDLRRIEMSPFAEREQKKLRREVAILQKLPPHKNVVQLVDAFEEGPWMFFVLELVGGGDLFTVLTSRPAPRLLDREAAFVLLQLVRGLQFLHGEGVIHRDLKLENVLVASEQYHRPMNWTLYSVKITDFGLSKSVGEGLSVAKSTVGTRPYTAPEVLKEGVHDFSSDLWCLGVLLFVLLQGHFPFDHVTSIQAEIDSIVVRAKATDTAKSVLLGFLRLEPSSRMALGSVLENPWLSDEAFGRSLERSVKRARSSSTCGLLAAAVPTSPVLAAAGAPRIPAAGRAVAAATEMVPVATAAAEPKPPAAAVADAAGTVAGATAAETGGLEDQGMELAHKSPSVHGEASVGNLRIPKGAWTPFAIDTTVRLTEVNPASSQPDVMQVHVVVLERLAGVLLGRGGSRIQQTAVSAGCPVWMTSRDGGAERRVVVFGTYKQCRIAQQLLHEQLASMQNLDWRDFETEVYILVRAEAAGVVTGKQGYVLDRIRKHSGARIQLLKQEVEGQRPCLVAGTLQSVLQAQRLVFHLVGCVPVAHGSADRLTSAASTAAAGTSAAGLADGVAGAAGASMPAV